MNIVFDTTVAIAGGVVVLSTATIIAKLGISLLDALWLSFIWHVGINTAAFLLGVAFSNYLNVVFVITIVGGLLFQAVVLQILARSKNCVIPLNKALVVSAASLMVDFLISAPFAAWLSPKVFG